MPSIVVTYTELHHAKGHDLLPLIEREETKFGAKLIVISKGWANHSSNVPTWPPPCA